MSTEPDPAPVEAPDEGEPTEETPAAADSEGGESDDDARGGAHFAGQHDDEPDVDPVPQPPPET